ncbi:MAG: stress response translation initiation inhibitor YciH [Planctomycetes bacterium]|nr:stress response translation initiation inhibitor YciH [Planctomycetota bacterium]
MAQHKLYCPAYSFPEAECLCGVAAAVAAAAAEARRGDGVVRVGRETQGRKGKGVTVVTGVPLDGAELAKLAQDLKKRCGSGGALKDGIIEIQGDHRDLLVAELQKRGWTVKKSGG